MERFPAANTSWPRTAPANAGLTTSGIKDAVDFAMRTETKWSRNLAQALNTDPDNNEPKHWSTVLGPTLDRAGPNGVVIRAGQVVAEWGDPTRIEMTFSATKSYLSLLTGIAIADGLVGSVDDRVGDTVKDGGYDSDQNRNITWRQLLQQTSEWEGTVWSKPDTIDHHRGVGPGTSNVLKGTKRSLQRPGEYWEYNDVRVNRLSLSLMQVFRRALPDVLRERIMEPIGASDTWRWHHYANAGMTIDGQEVFGVPGGAHWGGGLFISSEDHARVGWLVANGGSWNGQQLVPSQWLADSVVPCPLNPHYGFMWWLNTNRGMYPDVSADSFCMLGAGNHIVWIDRALDIVVVTRWIDGDSVNGLLARVASSLSDSA